MMSEEENKLLDAEEFKTDLERRVDENDDDGQKIGEYLEQVLPDWRDMRATRLYKYIQDMLKGAEEIRRFEIEHVWKRAIYFIPLMVIFFTAFGSIFYIAYAVEVSLNTQKFLFHTLFFVAVANAFLSFCLAMINLHSRRWQRNWEYQVDYLQAILGMKLMRYCLEKRVKFLTIGEANIFIGFFIFVGWVVASLFSLSAVWNRYYPYDFDLGWFFGALFIVTFFCILGFIEFCRRRQLKVENGTTEEVKMKVRGLQKFGFPENNAPRKIRHAILKIVLIALALPMVFILILLISEFVS